MLGKLAATAAVSGVLLLQAAGSASAQMYCSRPSVPYCISSNYTYTDDFAFSRCRSEVQSYISRVNSYVRCLQDEVNDVNREADRAIDQFNCKAQGNTFCY